MPASLTLLSQALPARGATRHQAKRQINSITKQKATITLIHFACLIVVVVATAAVTRQTIFGHFLVSVPMSMPTPMPMLTPTQPICRFCLLLCTAATIFHRCRVFHFHFQFSPLAPVAHWRLTSSSRLLSISLRFAATRRDIARTCRNLCRSLQINL